ncbi:MAG: CHAT domain-containing protein, partial [Saprospiraceae bacterium]|nr:CHAT domain-containing protein [Saprospiraceae bacterium]
REKITGKLDPEYAWNLIYLSNLYYEMGNYEKAIAFNLEATNIQGKILGKEHPDYLWGLNNLANSYWKTGDFYKAEFLHLEAKAIRERILGKEHADYAASLTCLANLNYSRGNYSKAETLYLEAKVIRGKVFGTQHPEYLWIQNSLANIYCKQGKYTEAESLFLEVKAVREKVLGNEHPDYGASLNDLANLYFEMGKYDQVAPLFEQLAVLNRYLMTKAVQHLSERELNYYLAAFATSQDQFFSYAQITARNKFHSAEICFDNSLFYKGFLLNAVCQIKRLAMAGTECTEKLNLLKFYERGLATEYAKPIAERKGIVELEEQAIALGKDLARTVKGYREAMRQVKWQEVQSTLRSGEVAIEFINYTFYRPKVTDSTMYAALVVRPGDVAPQLVLLFEEKELTPILSGAAGGSNFLKINALYASKADDSKTKSLYELIWQPLEPLLTDSKTVYFAPSGLLHRLNMSAIAIRDGQVYGQKRQLVVLGSTRQLVAPNTSNPNSSNDGYLAGGIRYDIDSTVLDYLPATAIEVREIGQILRKAGLQSKSDTGFYATEESFRQLGVGSPSPRIIHLATHGYFFPDPGKKEQRAGGDFRQEPVFKISEQPMIRSGLILAGAKQAWLTGKHPTGQEDGILTAYEISQMDISGTELVVLSACETGLGDIIGNEGVYGLQRAFKIAGAKYLIMSLWKVDDQSTREFMTSFYRHWLADKQDVPHAFRITQQEMRAKYSGAYDWAGFVLIE